jgi:drug/metabolite transporter (DMT)-like permease
MTTFFWMMGTLASFSVMAIAARELEGAIDTFQILFTRSLVGLSVISLIIITQKNNRLFATQKLPLHLARNISHFAGQYGWFLGLTLLPLATVFALEFTVPVWTAIIAAILLKERITATKSMAIFLGLVAVIIIVKPSDNVFNPSSIIVLVAAIFYALAYVANKSLIRTEQPLTILFYMCLIQLPIGFAFTLFNWSSPTLIQWGWLLTIGACALSAHYCIARAMQLSEVSVVVTLDFLRLPLIALVGVVFYAEDFNLAILVGGAIMLLGNLINTPQLHSKNTHKGTPIN